MPLSPHPRRVALAADPVAEVDGWAASGAMALTGRPDRPALGPPRGLVPKLEAIGAVLRARAAHLGGRLAVDPLALLGERAAISQLTRQGATSVGGAARLVRCEDGWLAVTLARPDDVELVPAWLELATPPDDPWSAIARVAGSARVAGLVDRARLLGLPAAALPAGAVTDELRSPGLGVLPVRAHRVSGPPRPPIDLAATTVVDLGALWAGPLCGSLLAEAGADVVKLESIDRPDGARRGPTGFFDLLNAGKRSLALDLRASEGVRALRDVLTRADVVIEASRPRALEQLGIHAEGVLGEGGPRVWVSITGHGRAGAARDWVGFGDDAAAAGGLVAWDEEGPCFCADAIADPTTGLVAATATLDALATGGRWLLDISMAGVAAHLAGPTVPVDPSIEVAPPRARAARGAGPRLGQHTAAVLAELGVPR